MKSDLEAILFISKESISLLELSSFFKVNEDEMKKVIEELVLEYKDKGINVCFENDEVFLKTNALKGEVIKNFFTPELKLRKLSKSAFEVLAVIAYKGPITKSEIEEIRSSGADHIIPILLEKKLIYVSGKKKALGNPNLYEVTQDFYAYLGIKDKEELLEFDKSNWLVKRKDEDENK
ncbi:SMC-Scp complex subunit ScpB [Streptobacillus felis]|uniref:SMC-Scp complex subunit ScpB n=2 Tax=Streptobacillus TaxID=34104 RepID=A0A7Z0PEQ7_9FUSO|nr:SMC-Scp complex subunit ScpB [Streptobacillus felis]NYV27807.1 SMC-Scp complex subunit ScpB [Streptobacillus felis]